MSAITMNVELISPDRKRRFQAEFALLDTTTGALGVLPNHANILGRLAIGPLRLKTAEGEAVFAIAGGFFEVRDGVLTILADACERADEIDRQRANAASERVKKRIRKLGGSMRKRDKISLLKALNRLRISGKALGKG